MHLNHNYDSSWYQPTLHSGREFHNPHIQKHKYHNILVVGFVISGNRDDQEEEKMSREMKQVAFNCVYAKR
jgi:hypothetical protein